MRTLGWGGRLRSASMCHDRVVQPDEEPSAMTLITIGLDLAKLVFQVHGVDESGRAVLKRKLHRHEVATFFEELPRCNVFLEACGAGHHWARPLSTTLPRSGGLSVSIARRL